jgi:hypothetical protein
MMPTIRPDRPQKLSPTMENKTLQEALEIPHLYEYFSNEGQNYRVEAREYYAKYYTENAELRAILGEEA